MPVERKQIDAQLEQLDALSPQQLAKTLSAFAALRLNPELEASDWINQPAAFVQDLSAWLWATDQMDAFHRAANGYETYLSQVAASPHPAMPRLCVVVVGKDAAEPTRVLFQKVRPHGVFFHRFDPRDGLATLLSHAGQRAGKSPQQSFAHWYIDGGAVEPSVLPAGVTTVSFGALAPQRHALLKLTSEAIASESAGPEDLRRKLGQVGPRDLGFANDPADDVLDHFLCTLLTEGSGTQIFSTTFVQWAGRECLRRAQPETLILRYAPRQQMQTMNAMLGGEVAQSADVEGSLIDAEMGAYYAWLEMMRLTGSEQASFLVWFEGKRFALAIGPGLPAGTVSDAAMNMGQILKLIT